MIRRSWTPEQANEWTREDWIAILLSPLVFAFLMIGVTKMLLLQGTGLLMTATALLLSGVIYWVIDPKLRAVSVDYESRQAEYLASLERQVRWGDDG